VTSVPSSYALSISSSAFSRALLQYGVLLTLAIAFAAEIIAGMDALWDRRRQAGMLLAIGIQAGDLRRAYSLFLGLPLVLATAMGGALGALIVTAYNRAGGDQTGIPGTVPIAILAILLGTMSVAPLLARRGVRLTEMEAAVRTE
jgi:hypothetical protein